MGKLWKLVTSPKFVCTGGLDWCWWPGLPASLASTSGIASFSSLRTNYFATRAWDNLAQSDLATGQARVKPWLIE